MKDRLHVFTMWLLLAAVFASVRMSGQELPSVYILATGGTIAGVGGTSTAGSYKPSRIGVEQLIEAVPEVNTVARVRGEQVFNVSSQDMDSSHWLVLSKKVNEILAMSGVDGVVITHGTDTMEETAFFLSLTVKSSKPVVLTGSMRPSTSLSADGPLNLFNAVAVAADKQSQGRGVMIAMNGDILQASGAVKTHTTAVQTFRDPDGGPVGRIHGGKVYYTERYTGTNGLFFDVSAVKTLPEAGIVYGYAGVKADAVRALVAAGYKGVVVAGVGNGNIGREVFPVLERAAENGIAVVRSTRVFSGGATPDAEVDDARFGFVHSNGLNPQKARILLMLSLISTSDHVRIQENFDRY